MAVLIASLAFASRSTAAAVSPADRAATHAYLLARYRYELALLASTAPYAAADEVAANRLGTECAGVLVGAPEESFPPRPENVRKTARQRGERHRESEQLGDLRDEVSTVLAAAVEPVDRPAAVALAATLRSLSWSNLAITQLIHSEASRGEEGFARVVPQACADMKAWVASDYRTLSPASKALVEEREHLLASALQGSNTLAAYQALERTEGPAEKTLERQITNVEKQLAEARSRLLIAANSHMYTTLGLMSHEKKEQELIQSFTHPHKDATRVDVGKTAAGSRFTIWLVHEDADQESGCKQRLEVEIETSNGSSSECASESGSRSEANVSCEEGQLAINARTLPNTRFVRLRLSNGRQITSRPALLPKRLGRVSGVYYQTVRGPNPIPIELVELGAHAQRLRSVKLRRVVGCSRHSFKYLSGGPLVLVREHTPKGPEFAITAVHFRVYGRPHFELSLTTGFEIGTRANRNGFGTYLAGDGANPEGSARRSRDPLDLGVKSGCHPYEYAIAYGLLRNPRDTASIEVGGNLQPLKLMNIPARFHAGGALVYAALSSAPERLLVRSPAGKTVEDKEMRASAKEARETCEGESEGTGPSVGRDSGTLIGFSEVS